MTLKTTLAKVASFAVATSLVVGVASFGATANAAAMTAAQVQSIISLLQSFGADAATIANVQASLTGSTPSVPSTPSTPAASCSFTRDLTLNATGADVTALQQGLIANGYAIAAGATGYFGAQTQAAVMAWQKAAGITPAAGYFGPKSRAAFPCSSGPVTGPTTPAPAGTGLSVAAGAAIPNQLATRGSIRVPFTNFNVTAGADGDVTINSITVQRTGLGQNAAFQGVVLVNLDTGEEVGTAKTFNSNNQASIGATMKVMKGQTVRLQVAANMASSLASYAGEAPAISVVGVNTTAAISGAFPITGAYHTINATLTTGSITFASSNSFATNATTTKELGTTAYRFLGYRLTAGSAEDVRLKSLRVYQVGSVAAGDLANVMIYVGGTAYPAMVSADGKYYSVNLGSGVVIPKGNQVEVYVQGDIVGTTASGRTVQFHVDRSSDIYATGETYNYGVSVSGGSSGTPYFFGSTVTVQGGSVTTIGKANSVLAQNIAVNVPNQPLGGFEVDLKGEGVTVQTISFTVGTSSGATRITNMTIVDQNGAVVAGPVDMAANATNGSTVTFSDSITFPTGKSTYTVRGKVENGATTGATYQLTTNPSSSSLWTNPKGDLTGNSVTFSQGSFTMNTMTVRAASLVATVASSPASQTIVSGGTEVLLSNIQLDASQSGEDVRVSSLTSNLTLGGAATASLLSSCKVVDGATALTTGSNSVNPSAAGANSFVFNDILTITKGTVKTLGIRCNVSSSAATNDTFQWGVNSAQADPAATGVGSGTTIDVSVTTSAGPTFTIGNGTVTVTTDGSSPSYKPLVAGVTDVTVGAYRFTATNEAISLQKLAMTLTAGAASSLTSVTVWDGATQVGTASFTGANTVATSTFNSPVLIPKNGDKVFTIKATFAAIGAGESVTASGSSMAIDFVDAQGVGSDSGSTVNITTTNGTTAVATQRAFRTVPTVAKGTLGATGLTDGKLLRFEVKADAARQVSLHSFDLNIATSSVAVTNVELRAFTNSGYSTPVSNQGSGGLVGGAVASLPSTGNVTFTAATNPIEVPAGGTLYFEVTGSVAPSATSYSATTKLLGDASFAGPGVAAAVSGNFVWSPNSTSTSPFTIVDWFNAFGVQDLPASGLIQTRSN